MVVIAIVAILAAVSVPAYKNYIERAKFTKVINGITTFNSKIKEFATLNSRYPGSFDLAFTNGGFADPSIIGLDADTASIQLITSGCRGAIMYSFLGPTLDNEDTLIRFEGNSRLDFMAYYFQLDGFEDSSRCYYAAFGADENITSNDLGIPGCVNIENDPSYTTFVDAFHLGC